MFILNKYVIAGLGLLAIVCGLFFYGVYSGRSEIKAKDEQIEADQRLAQVIAQQRDDAEAAKEVKVLTKTRTVTETVHDQITKIVDRPVYVSQCLDDDGLRLANAALTNTLPSGSTTPAVINPVPAINPPH